MSHMNSDWLEQPSQDRASEPELFGAVSPEPAPGFDAFETPNVWNDVHSPKVYNEQGVQTENLSAKIYVEDNIAIVPERVPSPQLPDFPSNSTKQFPSHILENAAAVPDNDGRKNVVFFGETGVGKSSVIKMFKEKSSSDPSSLDLDSEEVVPISSGAVGCTFASKGYPAELNSERYTLWDTAGLNEGFRGTITHEASVNNLASLLHNLGGRIHLLVYCIRGKRFRQVIKDNYDLFYRQFCRSQVPIVVVVTGLENEEPDMENWWRENSWEFERYGLGFHDHACITATRGKAIKEGGCMFDEEYEESQRRVRSLIERSCSETGCFISGLPHDNFQFNPVGQDVGRVGERYGEYGGGPVHDGYPRGFIGSHTGTTRRPGFGRVFGQVRSRLNTLAMSLYAD